MSLTLRADILPPDRAGDAGDRSDDSGQTGDLYVAFGVPRGFVRCRHSSTAIKATNATSPNSEMIANTRSPSSIGTPPLEEDGALKGLTA
jgi:hypothetical protein